ncbi:hypothetical protein [Myxococcus xanthus]|uniref:hypothetical protein n=1 Tax=Myxococcus xanthus TaxID=34 RepID=UPI00112CA48B|nr:hypothetical protein [Myxococcus xanthus]
MFFRSVLLWVPMLVGAGIGRWRRNRAGPDVPAVTGVWSLVSLVGALGVMMSRNAIMEARTIAWLNTLGVVPFELTPKLMQGVSGFAAFVLGFGLASMPWGAAHQTSEVPANASGVTGATQGPVNKHSSTKVLVIISSVMALGSGIGVVITGLKKGGFLTTSDVGGLPELTHVQEQLRPLEACSLTYQRRDKRGQRQHPTSVFIESCTVGEYISVLIDVPGTWADKGVGFEMTRGSMSEPWEILVEKADVPFPDLKEALEHFAPLIAARYPEKLRERRAGASEMERHLNERERQEQERKARAKTSYPE